MTTTLLNEIRDHEVLKVIAEADRLIEQGQPENARSAIKQYFGADEPTEPAKQAMSRVEAYLQARQLIDEGKGQETLDALATAFGDTNPSQEIKLLRLRGRALLDCAKMMAGDERYAEPMRMFGAITGAFGEDTRNAHALLYIEEALANELYRDAKSNGYEIANANYEAYRKRVPNLTSWGWVHAHMQMGALWNYRTDDKHRHVRDSQVYWEKWRDVRDFVANKPDKQYRFGCMQFMLARVSWEAVCDGATEWALALKAEPALAERHSELMACYRVNRGKEMEQLGRDLKTDLKYLLGAFGGGLEDMRNLIKQLYYAELRETLVAYAGSREEEFETEQMNALALLTEMGDTELIPDRFAVFQAQFGNWVGGGGRLERFHSKALFQAAMTYEDYQEFRRLIDSTLEDVNNRTGPWGGYTKAPEVLQGMLEDIRLAQPQHTAQFDGG